jgi:hypothetical protein
MDFSLGRTRVTGVSREGVINHAPTRCPRRGEPLCSPYLEVNKCGTSGGLDKTNRPSSHILIYIDIK